MLEEMTKFNGMQLHATDGEIGVVEDVLFDDHTWTARYLVVRTGSWFTGRKVLVSPFAVLHVHRDGAGIEVALTRRQVQDSPDFAADLPVSRQLESTYYSYYGWPNYWSGPYVWGPFPHPGWVREPGENRNEGDGGSRTSQGKEFDPHLRSLNEIRGYEVDALGSTFGSVKDFLMEVETWQLRYLVVDTNKFWPGEPVLVPAELTQDVDWGSRRVRVPVAESVIKRAPRVNLDLPVDRELEERILGYYGVSNYWGLVKRAS